MKHVQAEVPDIREFRSDLPASIVSLLSRLLAKSPDERFASPAEVLAFLRDSSSTDLADVWPEQTVPLPGAAEVLSSRGPMQATLQLQAQLRKARGTFAQRWSIRVGAGALVLLFFVAASKASFSKYPDLPETSFFKGIPKMESAEEQYLFALLEPRLDGPEKYEAVGHYFADDDNPSSRDFIGQANIQWARMLQRMATSPKLKRFCRRRSTTPECLTSTGRWLICRSPAASRTKNLDFNCRRERRIQNARGRRHRHCQRARLSGKRP